MISEADLSAISQNIDAVQEKIEKAASVSGRKAEDITLVAISKRHPVEAMQAAYASGLRHFGENRVWEAKEKYDDMPSDVVWHMVGSIQSRKSEDVVQLFDFVHSVDRPKLVRTLSEAAVAHGKVLDVLIQVNVTGEETKNGYDLSEWPGDQVQYEAFLEEMRITADHSGLHIRGLMTMAPFVEDPEEVRPVFITMRKLRERLQQDLPDVDWEHLSMGMTADYEVAVEEGATMVRIGTALFGARQY